MQIKHRLRIYLNKERTNEHDIFLMHLFSEYFVHADDAFLLDLVEANSSMLVSIDLMNELWKEFKSNLND